MGPSDYSSRDVEDDIEDNDDVHKLDDDLRILFASFLSGAQNLEDLSLGFELGFSQYDYPDMIFNALEIAVHQGKEFEDIRALKRLRTLEFDGIEVEASKLAFLVLGIRDSLQTLRLRNAHSYDDLGDVEHYARRAHGGDGFVVDIDNSCYRRIAFT